MSTLYEKILGFDDVHFGPRRKLLATIIVGAGLLTFFLPLINTMPSILNKTQWSMYEIVIDVYNGRLFPDRTDVILFPVEILIIYFNLLGALIIVYFWSSQRALSFMSVVGMWFAVRSWYWKKDDFDFMFSSARGLTSMPQVSLGVLSMSLFGTMLALLFITTCDTLDSEIEPKASREIENPGQNRVPEFLDVEILPPEEKRTKRPQNFPSLRD